MDNIKFFISSLGDKRHLASPEVFVALTDAVARIATVKQRDYPGESYFVDEVYPKTGLAFTSAKTGIFDSKTVMLTLRKMFTHGESEGEHFAGLKCAVSVDNRIIGFGVLYMPDTNSKLFQDPTVLARDPNPKKTSDPEPSVAFPTLNDTDKVYIAPEYTKNGAVFKTHDFLLVVIDWLIQLAPQNKMETIRKSFKTRSVLNDFTLCFAPISVMKSYDFHLWIGLEAVRGVIRWLYAQRSVRPNFIAEFKSAIKFEGKVIGSIFLVHGKIPNVADDQPLLLPTGSM